LSSYFGSIDYCIFTQNIEVFDIVLIGVLDGITGVWVALF